MKEFDENSTSRAEQETIRKQQEQQKVEDKSREQEQNEKQRIGRDRQTEDKRLAEERQKEYERNQKELQKSSDRRREADKERKEQQRQAEEMRKVQEDLKREQAVQEHQRAREQERKQTEAHKEHIPQSQELMDLANTQTGFERQIRAQSQTNVKNGHIVENHDYLKGKVDTLKKLDISMAECNDKALMRKYQATKDGIEQDIAREYKIYNGKPKMFQSKAKTQQIETEYRGKLQDKLQVLSRDKDQAIQSLAECKGTQEYARREHAIREKVQERLKTQEHTQTQGRSR